MSRFLRFAIRVTGAHVVTYLGVGVLAYALVTREFFDNPAGLAAQVLRTPSEPALWNHVMRWMLPMQVLRGVLIAAVLYPFLSTLHSWTYHKRVGAIAGLYVVLGQWASTVAGSGTIEGWLILRPEFTTPGIVVKAMIEGLVQGDFRGIASPNDDVGSVGAAQLVFGECYWPVGAGEAVGQMMTPVGRVPDSSSWGLVLAHVTR